ncbi:hypothetical protein M0R04_16560 [Candidatus Dojkabacteria bacterium]|jgi:hypothetical protein|nr:hypothetical protein [Candidatus Dojkabacteria bacterium]
MTWIQKQIQKNKGTSMIYTIIGIALTVTIPVISTLWSSVSANTEKQTELGERIVKVETENIGMKENFNKLETSMNSRFDKLEALISTKK